MYKHIDLQNDLEVIGVRYIRPKNDVSFLQRDQNLWGATLVFAIHPKEPDVFYVYMSVCKGNDNFDKKKGVSIAISYPFFGGYVGSKTDKDSSLLEVFLREEELMPYNYEDIFTKKFIKKLAMWQGYTN